jgi:hypothetical protein
MMSVPKLRDERLAWLAVRDELSRRSRSRLATFFAFIGAGGVRLGGIRGRTRLAGELHDERITGKMMRYSVAVDRVSRRLSRDERLHLRDTGRVPAWFMERVIAEEKTVKLR